jgi:hypothetical protein
MFESLSESINPSTYGTLIDIKFKGDVFDTSQSKPDGLYRRNLDLIIPVFLLFTVLFNRIPRSLSFLGNVDFLYFACSQGLSSGSLGLLVVDSFLLLWLLFDWIGRLLRLDEGL